MIINSSYNGRTIKGNAVMLSKYGDVYNSIDNAYHPNPGTKEDEYSEIERCIDWLIANNLKSIYPEIQDWIAIRVANYLEEEIDIDNIDSKDLMDSVLYTDAYKPCFGTVTMVQEAYDYFKENPDMIEKFIEKDELIPAEKIADYINEKFLRVRAGGKLNPNGEDAIYFRISSHGYDWHRTIVDFLWEIYEDPKNMPHRIWIGHDAETNPPETVLFDGTPNELFNDFDYKKFEQFKKEHVRLIRESINNDRKNFKLNRDYYCSGIEDDDKYKVFA